MSGLANTSQQVGGALGIAVLAALAAARTDAALSTGRRRRSLLGPDGYQLAFGGGAVLVAARRVTTVLARRRSRRLGAGGSALRSSGWG